MVHFHNARATFAPRSVRGYRFNDLAITLRAAVKAIDTFCPAARVRWWQPRFFDGSRRKKKGRLSPAQRLPQGIKRVARERCHRRASSGGPCDNLLQMPRLIAAKRELVGTRAACSAAATAPDGPHRTLLQDPPAARRARHGEARRAARCARRVARDVQARPRVHARPAERADRVGPRGGRLPVHRRRGGPLPAPGPLVQRVGSARTVDDATPAREPAARPARAAHQAAARRACGACSDRASTAPRRSSGASGSSISARARSRCRTSSWSRTRCSTASGCRSTT